MNNNSRYVLERTLRARKVTLNILFTKYKYLLNV